ncbi:TadE/TadG family type IV pilus assembly protein [Cryptosporangium phraense]|uniref:Pilus assembly protein n=1 Tax=Cryptosporangium phraense TaxID=2593070 RepID=A0A545ANG2_9ACTN|nr:TadE/TadG family type IV pilus assembly protein [Cryptosporangium phraense]TQS42813.1 pilus assembly protein [Cryptosporangium phraense]
MTRPRFRAHPIRKSGRQGRRWAGRPTGQDAGSVTVELTLLTPLLLLIVLFVVAAGRLADAQARLDQATYTAARAASLSRDSAIAVSAAQASADSALQDPSACAVLSTVVDTTAYQPGGVVTVRTTCVVDMADLTGLGIPGRKTLTSASSSPLDRFRATS